VTVDQTFTRRRNVTGFSRNGAAWSGLRTEGNPGSGPIEMLAETGSLAKSAPRAMLPPVNVRDPVPVSLDVGCFGEYQPN
jgi:hypothetical protein